MAISSFSVAIAIITPIKFCQGNSSLLFGVPYLRCCQNNIHVALAARCDLQHSYSPKAN
jgi:hypothetical protein